MSLTRDCVILVQWGGQQRHHLLLSLAVVDGAAALEGLQEGRRDTCEDSTGASEAACRTSVNDGQTDAR